MKKKYVIIGLVVVGILNIIIELIGYNTRNIHLMFISDVIFYMVLIFVYIKIAPTLKYNICDMKLGNKIFYSVIGLILLLGFIYFSYIKFDMYIHYLVVPIEDKDYYADYFISSFARNKLRDLSVNLFPIIIYSFADEY